MAPFLLTRNHRLGSRLAQLVTDVIRLVGLVGQHPLAGPQVGRQQGGAWGQSPVIKPNPRRKRIPHFAPVAYAQRQPIEQNINKLKYFRRVATRYDKLVSSYNAFVAWRVTTLSLN